MSKKTLKNIIAIVDVDGVETEMSIADIHDVCRTFALEKILQPANPMAPGSETLFGVSIKLSTPYEFSLDLDDKEE